MADDALAEKPINCKCPWSGKPISEDALALYRGFTVGFCNPDCRDKFVAATEMFDAIVQRSRFGA